MKQKNMIVTVVLVLIVGAAAFAGGTKYGQSQVGQNRRQFAGGPGTMVGAGGNAGRGLQVFNRNGGGARQMMGEILSIDDKSMTVKLADGSSKIVILSGTTSVVKSEAAEKTDLKVGEKVAVFGANNADGSVTAENIQLNPVFRGPGGSTISPAPDQGL